MLRNHSLLQLLSALSLAACATTDDGARFTTDRDPAVDALQRRTGAPVALDVGDAGHARVLAMTPGFPAPGRIADPAGAARDFLTSHHGVFQLDAADAGEFAVTRVDTDRAGDIRHVTLNRMFDGIPVFQGAITVHMDNGNGVFRVLGDDSYHIAPPVNRVMLSPSDAAIAAGRALGVSVSPVVVESDERHAVFTSVAALDPIHVDLRVVHVAEGDDRFSYQTTVSWLDDQREQHYELALIDAQDGVMIADYSLVNTFTGRVFNVNAQATANMTTDTRTVVSFDGNATASPAGWVGAARRTVGNNAVACTDLDRNNACGATEIQPAANASDSFDFPFDPLVNASSFREAAVANAFFLVNDFHDRTYLLGFTEAAGNFQTDNFGKGGAQNDEVQVDAQDASGTNNANFATPPDGSKPRMQMFLFTFNGGAQEDGDFDPTVIYHENSHGLSNRLVGGGSTACLGGLQSGGMGEGWGDFMGASFLNNPVIGAYVTGNAAVGIRQFAMSSSPFTYGDIKSGVLAEVHDIGELWAATLWDVRNGVGGAPGVGAAVVEQLVVSGMKLTPCNPTMLQARDGILQADVNINGGANRCKIFAAFAHRLMGTGASSPNHNSTTTIVTSPDVPPECGGTGTVTRDLVSTDVPKSIPDNSATGVSSAINVPAGVTGTLKVTVDVNITHQRRGELVIQVISPTGQTATLSNRAGGNTRNFVATGLDISSSFTPTASPSGQWRLFVQDLVRRRTGTINSFALHITSSN
ncbi:MAG TPA: M36 family metallopeptidase [Kofleriaceae bacterium]